MTRIDNTAVPKTTGDSASEIMSKRQLSPDDFIKLFLKQLTSQNPLHPTDSSTILQQMADISNISAAKDTQQALKDLQKNINLTLANTELLHATNMIGKKVEVPSGMSPLVKDEGLSGALLLPGAAKDIKVTIRNDKNEVVKELMLEPTTSGGSVDFYWDGLKDDKTAYDPGYYKISASANINGNGVDLETLGAFKVKSVASDYKSGEVIINVDALGGIGLKNIIKIL